ncbi:MAG: 6-phosphogluconolactonase [Candidatus Binatia bacterium]
MTDIQICRNSEDLYQQAATLFVRFVGNAMSARGRFIVALSGGSTPRGVYRLLAKPPLRERVPWPGVHLFWGDERCIPPTHRESNYRMAEETLISRIPIPGQNVHRVPAEQAPHQAACAYEQTIRETFSLTGEALPCFDLIFLGMGPDGHTASLFPGTAGLQENRRLVIAHCVKKLKDWRVTFTPMVLNHAAHVIFLVSGADKAATLREVIRGLYQPDQLPAQLIRPANGTLLWLVDEDAASLLHTRTP